MVDFNKHLNKPAQQQDLFSNATPEEFIEEGVVLNPAVKTFVPSPQQQEVFNWAQYQDGHAIVISVAGSGKTTTIVEMVTRITGSILILAFNKKIADELKARISELQLNNVKAATFHSHGWGLWRGIAPSCLIEGYGKGNAGYFKIARIFDEVEINGQTIPYIYKSFVRKAVTYAKQRLFGFEINMEDNKEWLNMVDHFDMDEDIANELASLDPESEELTISVDTHVQRAIRWSIACLQHSIKIAREVIDFEDMIYMPLISGMRPRWKNDWVLVDEAQDSNPARQAYVRLVLKPTGRTVWVGDPHQAIYGFTGADDKSLENIRHKFGCVDLPLTFSYRCPKAIVKVAQMWVSHIQAHPDAPEGTFRAIEESELVAMNFEPTDAILCRVNAPLVRLALQLIRRNIPCYVEGTDIGEGLLKLVDRFKDVTGLDHFRKVLEDYKEEEVNKAMAKGKEAKAENIADMVDCMIVIIASMEVGSTLYQLRTKIQGMFLDGENQRKQMLVLSSIHKSKGREWPRVFWYGPNIYQPSKYARQDWQRRQENNLFYVAATRAKSELYRVKVDIRYGKKV